MIFQHFPNTYVWERQLGQPKTIIWTNLVDPESPMHYTKIQSLSFLGSGEDKWFTIYRHGSHLVQWRETIKTHFQHPFDKRLHEKIGESCSSSFREEDI